MSVVVFDFETGGLSPHHPNIQLAAIAVDDSWNEIESFESKIAFDPSLCDAEALALNHYAADAWKSAPECPYVFAMFCSFLKRHSSVEMISKRSGRPYSVARLAAYNATFDRDRLWAMSGSQFVPAHPQALCIMQRAMWAVQSGASFKSFKLTDVAEKLGIGNDGAHDALADVRIAAAVARALQVTT